MKKLNRLVLLWGNKVSLLKQLLWRLTKFL